VPGKELSPTVAALVSEAYEQLLGSLGDDTLQAGRRVTGDRGLGRHTRAAAYLGHRAWLRHAVVLGYYRSPAPRAGTRPSHRLGQLTPRARAGRVVHESPHPLCCSVRVGDHRHLVPRARSSDPTSTKASRQREWPAASVSLPGASGIRPPHATRVARVSHAGRASARVNRAGSRTPLAKERKMSLPHYCQSGQARRLAMLTLMRQTHFLQGRFSRDRVMILFFDEPGLETEVALIQPDDQGNVVDAPASYRRFFLKEEFRLFAGGTTERA